MKLAKEIQRLSASAARALLASGAAEKAVSRQNEFAHAQLGETAYETFVDSQGNQTPAPYAPHSHQKSFLSGGLPSVSHSSGMEARASGLVHQTFRCFLEPQGHPVG